MNSNDTLAIIGVMTGIFGAVTGIISLVFSFTRDRARLRLNVHYATHTYKNGNGMIEVKFEISNVGNDPTSITDMSIRKFDGDTEIVGELSVLRDQHTQLALERSYPVDSPPPYEIFLPQRLSGHSSEVYFATFPFPISLQSVRDLIPYKLIVKHTHNTLEKPGISKPEPVLV
jgi:hypothetical protein